MKYYGSDGKQQQVYESRTRGGQRGLFTGRFMALPLDEIEDARQVAEACGFEFVETKASE